MPCVAPRASGPFAAGRRTQWHNRSLAPPHGFGYIARVQRRNPLTPGTWVLLALLAGFFGVFLVYPSGLMLKEAFLVDGKLSLRSFELLLQSPLIRESLFNSLWIATASTLGATAVALPIAWMLNRWSFRGKGLLNALLLVPLILPPFVGAIGLKQLLARFGSVNLFLMKLGILAPDQPIDWLGGGGMAGILALQVFNLYPILLLNLSAALAGVDPSLKEAGQSLGAGGWRLFKTVTLPLILPGYFAGAILVFIAAFTDLGTPLIFGFSRVVPVQIFDSVNDMHGNPLGFSLVVLVLALSLGLFLLGRRGLAGRRYEMLPRGHVASTEIPASPLLTAVLWGGLGLWFLASVLPHLAVIGQSFSDRWFFTILPEAVSGSHYAELTGHSLTAQSIRNSLFYSTCSAGIDLVLGVGIAWLLTRRRLPFAALLDGFAMLPLALPGLVLAFGYVAAFDSTVPWLNPRTDPTFLLILSYSVRRLPYIVRSAYAGFQQTSITLEEASASLGAGPWRTLRKITLPLVSAHLIAGTLLTFSFAMLEVSDGLILAMKDTYFPITKMIYSLMGRIDPNAASIASALGVVGMILLTFSLLLAGRLLGRRLGQIFRA